MGVNILFLEVEGILTDKSLGDLRTHETKVGKLKYDKEYIKHINMLTEELDLFIIFTSSLFEGMDHADICGHAAQAGLHSKRISGVLNRTPGNDLLTDISYHLHDQRHHIHTYFIINTPANLTASMDKNVFISLTGFSTSVYTQCLNRFKSVLKEEELVRNNKLEEAEQLHSKTLADMLDNNKKYSEEANDRASQLREADLYLTKGHSDIVLKYNDKSLDYIYKDITKTLSEAFKLLSKEDIKKILKDHNILDPKAFVKSKQVLPTFIGTGVVGCLYHFSVLSGLMSTVLELAVLCVPDIWCYRLYYKAKAAKYIK